MALGLGVGGRSATNGASGHETALLSRSAGHLESPATFGAYFEMPGRRFEVKTAGAAIFTFVLLRRGLMPGPAKKPEGGRT